MTRVLQDWITVRASANPTIPQSHASYLDLGDIDDIAAYIDIRQGSFGAATWTMAIQTSPSADDASFLPIVPPVVLPSAATLLAGTVLGAYVPVPVARFLRWVITVTGASSSSDCTFRILVATYALRP